mgnify:CR=1 FL=1
MNPLIYILIGIFSGINMGIVGIGAGILLIPLLVSTGVSIQTAVATGLVLQMVPQSLPGVWLYYKRGFLDWWLSLYIIIGSTIGIYIGAYLVNNDFIGGKTIYKLLFVILFLCTLYIGKKCL